MTTVPETVRAFLLPQLKELREHGARVHVATGQNGCPLPELAELDIVEHRLPLGRNISPLKDLHALIDVIKLCRKYHFDLIHTHTLKASLTGQLGARFAGVPVRIETAHGTRYMPDLPWLARKAILASERLAARQAHRVWVLNQEDLELFRKNGIGSPDTLKLLSRGGIGLDIEHYFPQVLTNIEIKEYRRSIGLPADVPVVGFVGRLVKDKGVNELYHAWQKLSARIPSAYLLIISAILPSERHDEVVSMERFTKLKNCVLLANRNDMNKLYRCMNVLVLPSYREGFSRVIMEAMASGVPVVASDVRGCRDVVDDGKTGILVPCRNIDLLSEAACRLILDTTLQKAMSEKARQCAVQYFDQRKINQFILQTYEQLLNTAG